MFMAKGVNRPIVPLSRREKIPFGILPLSIPALRVQTLPLEYNILIPIRTAAKELN